MKIGMILLLTATVSALCGCREEPADDSDAVLSIVEFLDGTSLDAQYVDALLSDPFSDLSSSTLAGSWVQDDETVTFNPDGSGTFTWTHDGVEETDVQYFEWRLDGNLLTWTGEETLVDDGCDDTATSAELTAVVDGAWFSSVMIRVEGTGDTLDGTWVGAGLYIEMSECPEVTDYIAEVVLVTQVITGETFTITTEWETAWSVNGAPEERDSGQESVDGSIVMDGEIIRFRMPGDEELTFNGIRMSDNTILTFREEPGDNRTVDEVLSHNVYTRQ